MAGATVSVPGIPRALGWTNPPESWSLDADGQLAISAGAATDWFASPAGDEPIANSPRLTFEVDGPCLLAARVEAELGATFDAGALVVYRNPAAWAKLCIERSPEGRPTLVTVVTRGTSDDCNGCELDAANALLRVALTENACAFHSSSDGRYWTLVRHFALAPAPTTRLGFSSQSPTGPGCTARFSEVNFTSELLTDIRSGR